MLLSPAPFRNSQRSDLSFSQATRSLAQQEELAASVSTEDLLLLPEGGSNDLGLYGCAEILGTIPHTDVAEFDVIATACGTGALSHHPGMKNFCFFKSA